MLGLSFPVRFLSFFRPFKSGMPASGKDQAFLRRLCLQ
jgi:hypothetical protein